MRPFSATFRTLPIILLLFLTPALAWAYRPFVSTDAAVADSKEMEIELGYFNWARNRGKTTFIVPKAVLNYGLIQNVELVGEFGVEVPPHGSVQLVDPALSLKAVLKEGVLQEKSGISLPSRRDRSCPLQIKKKTDSASKGSGS
jgi:hypothetical protein